MLPFNPDPLDLDKLKSIVGPPPLLNTENAQNYEAMLLHFMEALKPRDFFLQTLIKNLVDTCWEGLRFPRHKAWAVERRDRRWRELKARHIARAKDKNSNSQEEPQTKPERLWALEWETIELAEKCVELADGLGKPSTDLDLSRAMETAINYYERLDRLERDNLAKQAAILEQIRLYDEALVSRRGATSYGCPFATNRTMAIGQCMTATKNDRRVKRTGGPRFAAGRSKTSRNALKHGLAACHREDPLLLQQTRELASAICGDDHREQLFEHALMIAEFDQLLRQVLAHRVVTIERLQDALALPISKDRYSTRMRVFRRMKKQRDVAHSEFSQLKTKLIDQGEDVLSFMNARRTKSTANWKYEPLKDRDEFEMMREAIEDLERLRRYERRAWSRRSRAIRRFLAIKTSEPPPHTLVRD